MRGPRCEVRGSRYEVRGARSEVRGPRFEVRGARYEVRGTRCEVRGPRYEVRGARLYGADASIAKFDLGILVVFQMARNQGFLEVFRLRAFPILLNHKKNTDLTAERLIDTALSFPHGLFPAIFEFINTFPSFFGEENDFPVPYRIWTPS